MIFTDERRRRGTVLVTPAIQMTAAASGSNGITVADDDDIDFGTGDFFLHWEGSLPDWTPSAQERLIRKYNGSTAGFVLNTDTNGTLIFFLYAGAGLLSYSSTTPVGLQNSSSAKVTVSIARSSASTAGSVTFYLNGTQLGSPVSIAAAASITASTSTAMAICGGDGTTGTQRTASNTISCIVGNFAPTAAEVLDLCTNGIPASWQWGSMTPIYQGDYSVGVDSVTASLGATLTANIDGVDGENDWLKVERTGASGNVIALLPASGYMGKKISASVKINNPAGSGFSYFYVSLSASTPGSFVVAVAEGSSVTISGIGDMGRNTVAIAPCTVAGENVNAATGKLYYIKSTVVMARGATMALLPNSIPTSSATTWSDASGNTGGGTLPAAGATKVTIRK